MVVKLDYTKYETEIGNEKLSSRAAAEAIKKRTGDVISYSTINNLRNARRATDEKEYVTESKKAEEKAEKARLEEVAHRAETETAQKAAEAVAKPRPGRRHADAWNAEVEEMRKKIGDVRTVEQVAAALGITTRAVQKNIANGKLRAKKIGGSWRIAIKDFDAFIGLNIGLDAVAAPVPALTVAAPAPAKVEYHDDTHDDTGTRKAKAQPDVFLMTARKLRQKREFVRICDLRKRLNWPKADFDAMLRKLRDAGTIQLHAGNVTTQTPGEVEDGFIDENGYRMGNITLL